MNNMTYSLKNLLTSMSLLLLLTVWYTDSWAQKGGKDTTVTVKTSVICDMCKERIERELVFEKGVKEVSVDLKAKTVKIIYKTGKTNIDKIRKAISKLGYRADEVLPDPKGQAKLPACCKDEGCGKD